MDRQGSLSTSDTFIIDLAIEAERAGVPVAQLASRADKETIALAEVLQEMLGDIRHKLNRRAVADGESAAEVDASYRALLGMMLGRRGAVH